MAAIRSLALKTGGRALQRSPAICPVVEVEQELLLHRLPHGGLFGRPPVVKSRLFSSGGSDTSELLCKNCLHPFAGPAADARSHLNNLGPKGLREEVEKKKKDLLYALLKMDSCTNLSASQGENREELGVLLPLLQPKTQQPRLEELLDRPMKFCFFVICAAPIVAVLCVYRNSTRPFPIDEE